VISILLLYVIVVHVSPTYTWCALNLFSGATTSSVRGVSGGGKESEGEVGRVKDGGVNNSKTSHSHSVGITNENGGGIGHDQVSFVYSSILIGTLPILNSYFIFQIRFHF
jgi:hypothetical protein